MKKVIAILAVLMSVISMYAENITIYKLEGNTLSHDTVNNVFYYDVVDDDNEARFVFNSVEEIYEFMTMFDGIKNTMDEMVYTNNGMTYKVSYNANTLFMAYGNELYHVMMAQNGGRIFKLYIKKYLETGEPYKTISDMFND